MTWWGHSLPMNLAARLLRPTAGSVLLAVTRSVTNMAPKVTGFSVKDIRFPTSLEGHGSDAMVSAQANSR